MRYYFHKLGRGNSLFARYLGDRRPGDTADIAIFFGMSTCADCRAGKHGLDARNFCTEASAADRERVRIVVIAEGDFLILQPAGEVRHGREQRNEDGGVDLEKLMPVRVLARRPVAEVPHLLASMGSNAYFVRGTFRRIGNDEAPRGPADRLWDRWAHHVAIEHQLPSDLRADLRPPCSEADRLQFLSSVELETLVAKVLEEAGCFVPAYRGGTMAGIDIIARNDDAAPRKVAGLDLAPGQAVGVQVKSWMAKPERAVPGIFLVSLNLHPEDRNSGWDAAALLSALAMAPRTRGWLRRSLAWLEDPLAGAT
jgi:hypothetical protein